MGLSSKIFLPQFSNPSYFFIPLAILSSLLGHSLSTPAVISSTNSSSSVRDPTELHIYAAATKKHNVNGSWRILNEFSLEIECVGMNLHSLLMIPCDSLSKCAERLTCIDTKGKDCDNTVYQNPYGSMSSAYLGGIQQGVQCTQENAPSIFGGPLGCLTVSPFDDPDSDFGAIVECTSDHFQRKTYPTVYKAQKKRFVSFHSPQSDWMNMTISRYNIVDGELQREYIFVEQPTSGTSTNNDTLNGNLPANLTVYADSALWIDCGLEPFFFGDARKDSEVFTLTNTAGVQSNFSKTYGYIQGIKIRVSADLASITCSAKMESPNPFNRTISRTVNVTVIVPPTNLTVPAESSGKSGSRLTIDQRMGCKFNGTEEKNAENQQLLRGISRGIRTNVIKSTMQYLRFRDQVNEQFECAALVRNSSGEVKGPFNFLLDFVPSKPLINKTVQGQDRTYNVAAEIDGNGRAVIHGDFFGSFLPSLTCRYQGDPKPHVAWFHNGKELHYTIGAPDPDTPFSTNNEVSILYLNNVNLVPGKPNNFTCIAKNYLGKDSLDFVVKEKMPESAQNQVKKGFESLYHVLEEVYKTNGLKSLGPAEALIKAHGQNQNQGSVSGQGQDQDQSQIQNPPFHVNGIDPSHFSALFILITIVLIMNLVLFIAICFPQWKPSKFFKACLNICRSQRSRGHLVLNRNKTASHFSELEEDEGV